MEEFLIGYALGVLTPFALAGAYFISKKLGVIKEKKGGETRTSN